MSATVSSFGDARRKRASTKKPDGNFRCPDCGSQWFIASVVVQAIRGTGEPGDVVGYKHPLRCTQCGWAQE